MSKLELDKCSSKAALYSSYAIAPPIPSAKKVRDLTSFEISGALATKTTATWAQSYISAVSSLLVFVFVESSSQRRRSFRSATGIRFPVHDKRDPWGRGWFLCREGVLEGDCCFDRKLTDVKLTGYLLVLVEYD